MNQEIIDDFKQFITALFAQQSYDLNKRLDAMDERFDEVDARINGVEETIKDLSFSVAEAITVSNEVYDELLRDHEVRITRLEQMSA